jgi:hypothetical protein
MKIRKTTEKDPRLAYEKIVDSFDLSEDSE